jgi:hypothetical protein
MMRDRERERKIDGWRGESTRGGMQDKIKIKKTRLVCVGVAVCYI